jgi:hypothetical protein
VVLVLSVVFVLSIFGGFIPVVGKLLAFLSPYAYSPIGLAIHGVVLLSAIATNLSHGSRAGAA